MKLWGGRFREETARKMEEFNDSLSFDIRLYRHDITGSRAHVKMLSRQGIITEQEKEIILAGLDEVKNELEEELTTAEFSAEEAEDVHTLIEKRLTEKIGDTAGRLHTGRSRNDQVALDMRLFLREEVDKIKELILTVLQKLLTLAEDYRDTVMPGYTHLQRAQPVTFGHHLLAYYFKFKRDLERFIDCRHRINILPLGSAALAGSTLPLDRQWLAEELDFRRPSFNSIDGVSDRDFVIEFENTASIMMVHLSRLAEELILWSSSEFSFIEIADEYSTGSSIMPQKKNPDLPELIRGKTGRVFGNLMQMLTTLKGLPLSFNKDMQGDKEGLFDTVDTLKIKLEIFPSLLSTMKVKEKNLKEAAANGFVNATEMADYLVEKGIPFRKAHRMVGRAVLEAQDEGKELSELSLTKMKKNFPDFKELFDNKLKQKLKVEKTVHSRNTMGGPAPIETKRIIENERKYLQNN